MTTRTMSRISGLLREKRGDASKASVYERLDISSGTYDSWENSNYIPSAIYGERLAEYLELTEQEVAWILYVDSKDKAMGLYRESNSRTLFDFLDENGDVTIDLTDGSPLVTESVIDELLEREAS